MPSKVCPHCNQEIPCVALVCPHCSEALPIKRDPFVAPDKAFFPRLVEITLDTLDEKKEFIKTRRGIRIAFRALKSIEPLILKTRMYNPNSYKLSEVFLGAVFGGKTEEILQRAYLHYLAVTVDNKQNIRQYQQLEFGEKADLSLKPFLSLIHI